MSGQECRISCIIYTLNEEVNLPKCLESLKWCDDVVVVDTYSSDRTESIARASGARFFQHPFTGFGDQRNWSLEQIKLKHPWVLILDADERVTPELAQEMNERLATVPETVAAFRVARRFFLWGKWLKHSSLYPTWVVRIIRVGRVRYLNRGHAETQVVEGHIDAFKNDLIDENLKDQHEWWSRQNNYSTKEALYESAIPRRPLSELFSADPLKRREAMKSIARRLPARPIWFFLYSYVFRMGFLDGAAGLRLCLMKMMYSEMIELKKYEKKIREELGQAAPASAEERKEPRATSDSYSK